MKEYIITNAPLYINWNFTYICNFNCEHCYSRSRTLNELNIESKLIVCDNIIKNKVFTVNLGGGEPLLSRDLFDVIKRLSENNIRVNLSTNGWKTEESTIQELKKSGLGGVSVSIDNILAEKHDETRNQSGAFVEAVSSIKKYIKSGIDVFISTTITAKNFDYLEDIIDLGNKLGCTGIDLKRLKTMGNASHRKDLELNDNQVAILYEKIVIWRSKYPITINLTYDSIYRLGIDTGCPCGKTSMGILDNGDIVACIYNPMTLGNAVSDDIGNIWLKSDKLNYLRANYKCLGLMKKKEDKAIKLSTKVMQQKDFRINPNERIIEYIQKDNVDPEILADDAVIMIVGIDGNLFQLNLVSSIILEELSLDSSEIQIIDLLCQVFDTERDIIENDFELTVNDLKSSGILE